MIRDQLMPWISMICLFLFFIGASMYFEYREEQMYKEFEVSLDDDNLKICKEYYKSSHCYEVVGNYNANIKRIEDDGNG